MGNQGPRPVQSRGPERRAISRDWETAQPEIDDWLRSLDEGTHPLAQGVSQVAATVATLTVGLERMGEDVHDGATALRDMEKRLTPVSVRTGIMWAGLTAGITVLLTALVGGGVAYWWRAQDASHTQALVTARDARVEAIADAISGGGIRKNLDGTPAVAALQAALPDVRGITRRDRDEACARLPARACGPP